MFFSPRYELQLSHLLPGISGQRSGDLFPLLILGFSSLSFPSLSPQKVAGTKVSGADGENERQHRLGPRFLLVCLVFGLLAYFRLQAPVCQNW